MEQRTPSRRTLEAGFLLVEAVVAVALVAICAGAALAAVAAVTHAQAQAQPASALTLTAQNILTDLRAATAYDPAQLATLAGRSAEFDAAEPGADGKPRRVHIVVGVRRPAANEATVAEVTISAEGVTMTVDGTLVQEAPAPGSTLSASTPPPPDPSAADGPDQISL